MDPFAEHAASVYKAIGLVGIDKSGYVAVYITPL
jgi:hypothetical protein